MATDKLRACADTDCCLTSGSHNTDGSKAPAEKLLVWCAEAQMDFRRTYKGLKNLSALRKKHAPPLCWSSYSMKRLLVKAHSLFLCPSHAHTYIHNTPGFGGGMPQRSGAACCFYQQVRGEVKNLIPPPPDNYMSLGTVSFSDIPLYMTTSHVSGLLTISTVIAGDLVYMLV